jgi:tetratricopeptide (TPR) repeat protein
VIDFCKRSLLFLITGRDETYTAMPAGYLLHAYSIRYAIAHGFTNYDFCKGNESYKYLFGARERHLTPVEVRTVTGRNLGKILDPSWIPTMLRMTLDSEEAGEMADAELGYRQIIEVAPDNALALYRFGRFMAQTGAYGEAKRMLSRSVEIEPDGDNAWFWLARSHQSLGENDAALEACRKVVFLQPENEEAKALLLRLSLAAKAVSRTPLSVAGPVNAMGGTPALVGSPFDAADVLRRLAVPDPARRYKL